MKTIHVSAMVDFMGTSQFTPEEEYENIKKEIEEALCCEVVMKVDVTPHKLERCDLYVFDYGGMLPGSEGLTNSLYRGLARKIEEMPSTVFWIWSSFTAAMYAQEMGFAYPELEACPYLIMGPDLNDKLPELLGVGHRPSKAKPGLKAPRRQGLKKSGRGGSIQSDDHRINYRPWRP